MSSAYRMPLDVMRIRPRRLSDPAGTSHTMGSYGKVRGTRVHQGWDLSALPGSEIYAIADGKVVDVEHIDRYASAKPADKAKGTGAYGRTVTLEFKADVKGVVIKRYAFYAHLALVLVKAGQQVKMGDVLGMTGTSGNASGEPPHLHFEIRTARQVPKGLTNRMDPAELLGYSVYSCQM